MRSEIRQGRINSAIETTFKNLSDLIDVNTVVGSPIKTGEDDFVIPISKVTVGVLAGGGEYGKLGIFQTGDDHPFSAGNGTIVSVKPCGFLIKEGEKYKIVSVSDTPYEKLIEKASEFMSQINCENEN